MNTVNKRIACTPFQTTQVRMEARGGLPSLRQRKELTKLTVVLPGEGYEIGDIIWLRGDAMKLPYALEVFEEGDKAFILVPTDHVIARARNPKSVAVVLSGVVSQQELPSGMDIP